MLSPLDKEQAAQINYAPLPKQGLEKTTAFLQGYTTGENPCLMVLLRKSWKIGLKMAQTVGVQMRQTSQLWVAVLTKAVTMMVMNCN